VSDADPRGLAELLINASLPGPPLAFSTTSQSSGRRRGGVVARCHVDAAEQLYRHLGWTHVGTIPRYALDPDGTPYGAAFFYLELA
jgi:hypothetical protein